MNPMRCLPTARRRRKALHAARLLAFSAWCIAVPLSVSSETQTQPPVRVFSFIADEINPGGVQLANGHPVDITHWATFVNATMRYIPLANGGSFAVKCSATLVGPGVLLTAAHCLDPDDGTPLVTQASLSVGGQTIPIACEASPQYTAAVQGNLYTLRQPRVSQDYALCDFAVPDSPPAALKDVRSEVIDATLPLSANNVVVMTGYGCKNIRIGADNEIKAGDSDNVLRIGTARVTQPANPAGDYSEAFISIISSSSNKPIICPGDSGGPLMSSTATDAEPPQPRRIRGVNSFVTIMSDNQGVSSLASAITPLASTTFRTFMSTWVNEKSGRRICGFNLPPGIPPCAS
jgi:secreted trypsin-like serine protease